MSPAIGENLAALLHPVTPKDFFSEYWNRKAIYIPGDGTKFSGLFDRNAFNAAARHCELLKVNYLKADGWPAEMPISADQIPEMLALGRSVCAGGVEKVDPILSAFIERFSTHFVQMGQFYFNSYLSPGGQGIWPALLRPSSVDSANRRSKTVVLFADAGSGETGEHGDISSRGHVADHAMGCH